MHFPAWRSPEDHVGMFVLMLILMFINVKAQSPSQEDLRTDTAANFQPSLAVVIGILAIMFSLTFILLLYAKLCHRASSVHGGVQNPDGLTQSRSRFSGIDKTVIESLPFFRFSSLRGSRGGLECAVCLSKFEDIEVLRLLPRCKHAFHIDCVDQWLEKHSSCPLCRHTVSVEDLTFFTNSSSLRFRQDSNLELFIQREEDYHGSSRFSNRSSSRKFDQGKKEEELPIQGSDEEDDQEEILHKFNHKIIVSDVVLKNRWSSVSSSDLMFLKSEMINAMSSDRFSPLDLNEESAKSKLNEDGKIMKLKEEIERKRFFESKINQSELIPGSRTPTPEAKGDLGNTSKVLNPTDKRSMSEIIVHPRFAEFSTRESSVHEKDVKEERMRRLWLPIARRTVQWFANRERRSPQPENTRDSVHV
ncbi:hypothetical protein RJ640_027428 [Escallonia rubra]|uniref:RING-type E3 ubiquitin transferase n=1 Tax=Escallonia rubra TaxID=112253 RepID=A0AA88QYM9_9ASTE|nr:hypothetical protein RJ640_027428 [Escallonia rubra]